MTRDNFLMSDKLSIFTVTVLYLKPGPPKVKGRFVFDLDTEMYAKLQQGELMIGYPDILLFELG